MAQHHHHHDHAHHHHPHGAAAGGEGPLDAANQSLADALRSSFRILKFIMVVLVIMYAFSGVQCIEEHEQAVVFRFGKLLDGVRGSGPSLAFPYPIDETLRFPTRLSNQFAVRSHWPKAPAGQEAEALNAISGADGLKPGVDGALLTADRGLVHMQWMVTYRVGDLRKYVLHVADQSTADVEALITAVLEQRAGHVVSRYSAEDVTRGQSSNIAREVREEVNQHLAALDTGVEVVSLEIPRSSVPGQTIAAFDAVAAAENEKRRAISEAEQARDIILNGVAGAAHTELTDLLDRLDAARSRGDAAETAAVEKSIDDVLETRAAGFAGDAVSQAKSFYTQAVQKIQGDVQQYEAVLGEYRDSRELFISRMWEQTRRKVLSYDGVTKNWLAPRETEVRIKVGPDPEQRDIEERRKLEQESEMRKYQPEQRSHAIIP